MIFPIRIYLFLILVNSIMESLYVPVKPCFKLRGRTELYYKCYNYRVCPISNNVCVIIPTYILNKIFKQINDPSTLSFLFIFQRKKIKQIRKTPESECFFSLFLSMEHKEKCIQCE